MRPVRSVMSRSPGDGRDRAKSIDGFIEESVLQRLLFENLRRPAAIRRTLNQV